MMLFHRWQQKLGEYQLSTWCPHADAHAQQSAPCPCLSMRCNVHDLFLLTPRTHEADEQNAAVSNLSLLPSECNVTYMIID